MQANSKSIAGLLGPTLLVILVSEFPYVQPHLYDDQTAPVAYLSGVLLFVAGLATVRAHNHWARDPSVLVTLTGWGALGLGIWRAFAASAYVAAAQATGVSAFVAVETALLVVALALTWFGYDPSVHAAPPPDHSTRSPRSQHDERDELPRRDPRHGGHRRPPPHRTADLSGPSAPL